MARKFLSLRLLPLLLLFATLAGCGYYNPNMLPDEELGPQVNLYVPVWPNSTNELNLETNIRNAISDWLMQSKRITLVGTQAEADYLLSGSVVSVSYPGLSYDATDTAKTLKAVLTVSYTIKEVATGRTIWQMSSYSLEETYNLGASNAQTDTNKRQALQTLTDKLGEQLYIRLFRVLMKQQRRGGAAKTPPATPAAPTMTPAPLPSR
ncbi:MAG: LPS assembly lipoprotein LptE [Thermodesulfobacteriota bacterium]